jgi:hypothetical protein
MANNGNALCCCPLIWNGGPLGYPNNNGNAVPRRSPPNDHCYKCVWTVDASASSAWVPLLLAPIRGYCNLFLQNSSIAYETLSIDQVPIFQILFLVHKFLCNSHMLPHVIAPYYACAIILYRVIILEIGSRYILRQ